MGYRYTLSTSDGELFGEAEYSFTPAPGNVIYVRGTEKMRVTAVIPTERMREFIDRPIYGVLEVEPLG